MISGLLTATAANPFDTIKSRYMSDNTNTYSSVFDCAVKSYRKDGAKVFLQGWYVYACKSILSMYVYNDNIYICICICTYYIVCVYTSRLY